jgi:sulfur carrier protein
MKLVVNGEAREAREGLTVKALLADLGAADRRVAVMVNDAIVPRHAHAESPLQDGDRVEILSLVAGG